MKEILAKQGDIFCTRNPMLMGRIINFVQKLQSKDNESTYSHAGIITDCADTSYDQWHDGFPIQYAISFEALWTNHKQKLYETYKGKRVLIGRHRDMTKIRFLKGWNGIKHHDGKWYAGHRLPLFFIPFMAKYMSVGPAVCSEIVMKFMCKSGLATAWSGWNPDDVADMIRNYREWEIVYEGILECSN